MKKLILASLALLASGCMNKIQIPQKIVVKGDATVRHVITIELPEVTVQQIKDACKDLPPGQIKKCEQDRQDELLQQFLDIISGIGQAQEEVENELNNEGDNE